MFLASCGLLVSRFVVNALVISAGLDDPVGVARDGVPANDDVPVSINLCAVDFHGVLFLWFWVSLCQYTAPSILGLVRPPLRTQGLAVRFEPLRLDRLQSCE